MKKIVISILAVALIVVCIGCGSDKKPTQETKKPPTAASRETKTVEPIDDAAKAPETPAEPATPTITDEEPEIIGSADDIVAWRYKTGSRNPTYLVDNGKVFVVNDDACRDSGKVFCLDAKTGKKYWENDSVSYGVDFYILTVTEAFIYVRAVLPVELKSDIICYDIETGEKLSQIHNSPHIVSQIATSGVSIFFITDEGILHCYDVKTGKQLWELKGFVNEPRDVQTTGDKVFCCAGKTLSCLNAQDGKQLWQFKAGNFASLPSISDGKVYFGTQSCSGEEASKTKDYFYCLDLQTGSQEWSIEMESPIYNEPIIIDNYVCTMDCKNRAYIGFDLSEQKKMWQINMDGLDGVEVFDKTLYVMIGDKWSIADIATGQITKQLDFGAKYNFAQQRNYSIENGYVQCDVPGSIITDSMFESPPRTRLQRVYSNDNVYVSNYPNIAAGKVYACTVQKKLWETPNNWTLEPTSFPGVPYSYFWDFNDKVMVMRKDNNAYFYTCLEKSTGKKLWEIPKGNYRIDAFDNVILTLHSITDTKDIDISDGSTKNERPTSFDKQIIFETKLSNDQMGDNGANVYDLSEGLYLYANFQNYKIRGVEKDRYLVDKNGKVTPLYIYSQDSEFENIRRYKSKLYVMSKTSDDVFDIIEVDIDTGKTRSVKEIDVPTNAVLLQKVQNNEPSETALNNKIIKKIGITPHKPDEEYYHTYIKGIYYGKYLICQREISEGMEYAIPYSDYTGIYDAKTLKKLWSYDKNVGNIYFHDSTIIINGDWGNQVVLFCDLATGKTLLKYDKATLLSKVGDICFVASGDKLIAVNLKKLPK